MHLCGCQYLQWRAKNAQLIQEHYQLLMQPHGCALRANSRWNLRRHKLRLGAQQFLERARKRSPFRPGVGHDLVEAPQDTFRLECRDERSHTPLHVLLVDSKGAELGHIIAHSCVQGFPLRDTLQSKPVTPR